MGFEEIEGQLRIKEHLKKAVNTGKISHAYIFNGDKSCPKEEMAAIFAAELVCEGEGEKPCGKCHACKMALSESHPDIIRVAPSGKTGYKVDDIRDQINSDIIIKPFWGERKVYIVAEAQKLNIAAQNALLKTLEEPPAYALIILLTENYEALLDTIRSRCVRLDFDSVRGDRDTGYVLSLVKNISGRSAEAIIAQISPSKSKDEGELSLKSKKDEILDLMLAWYRDVLLYKSQNSGEGLYFSNETEAIRREAGRLDYESIIRITRDIEKARARMNANVKPENVMESLLLAIRNG